MSEQIYDSNWPAYFTSSGIAIDKDPMSLKSVIKTILANIGTGASGTLLQRVSYAPTSVDTATAVVSTTGLTSVNFTTGADVGITFTVPLSGKVLFSMKAFIQGPAAAGTSVVFGVVTQTHATSPGALVSGSTTALAFLSPTATAADNGVVAEMTQLITGLTAGASLTWYGAQMYSGTASSIKAQGSTSATAVPTGSPYILEVIAA